MKEFSKISYRGQVRLLRQLAIVALTKYPIKIKKINLINYGENATFKVVDTNHCKFLLRVCRNEYHSKESLLEELSWLRRLSSAKEFQLPNPVLSKAKRLLEFAFTEEIPEGRKVALFHWTEGRFLENQISANQMEALGTLVAKLHNEGKKTKVKHRKYWNSEGLIGKSPKFGTIDHLKGATASQQKIVTAARMKLFKKLKDLEIKYPEKMGLIHADIHTGNFFFNKNGIVLIDFDDCGFGFFGYDIAIPMMSLDRFKKLKLRQKALLKEAFYKGYRNIRHLTEQDVSNLDYFILARRLAMLGWLNSRSDNPKLKKYFKIVIKKAIKSIHESGF